MSSIFTKIINEEIPAYKIAEDDDHLAFLDAMPLVEGHTLVIPKKEIDVIFDLDSEEFKNLWAFAQQVAKKIEKAMPCIRVGVAVVGLEVPHAHIHLIPMNNVGDMNFSKEKLQPTQEELAEAAAKIAAAVFAVEWTADVTTCRSAELYGVVGLILADAEAGFLPVERGVAQVVVVGERAFDELIEFVAAILAPPFLLECSALINRCE